MQGSSNGPLATLLMLVALVAVPLLAIFGVPQLSPLAASPAHQGVELNRDRDDGLDQPARVAGDGSKSSASHTDKRNPRGMSSAGTSKRGGSTKEATRQFIPRDAEQADDPFLEINHSAGDRYAQRDPRDASPRRDAPPREFPGWEVEQLPPRGAAGAERDHAGHPHSAGNARRNNADQADADVSGREAERARNDGDLLADASHEPVGDDTARLLNDAPAEENNRGRNHNADDAAATVHEPQDANSVVATLGSAKSNAANALSRAKHGVEVASERIERRGPLTWKAAVQRLNGLGIRQYQLQPGQNEGEFHFSCAYVHRDAPRISHRFEAEAPEPLRAVEKVLAQLETWMDENEKR